MMFRRMACGVAVGFALVAMTGAVHAEPRAVVELFTSQGCSSCPKADKLLGELAADPSLVVLSLPVDYWDYLGWKDTLANPRHTARQKAYARQRGDRQIYTPQVVINGVVHALGSDKSAIEHAIEKSHRNAPALTVPVKVSVANGQLTVTVPAAATERTACDVWLSTMTKAVPVVIERGENRGKTVTYHNVARRWIKLGEWSGKAATWTVPLKDLQTGDVDSAAVIIQDGTNEKPGTMLGAATASLH